MVAMVSTALERSAAAEAVPADMQVTQTETESAPAETWLTQAKKPLPWLELEADVRARAEYSKAFNSGNFLQRSGPRNETNLTRYRTRFGVSVKPIEEIEVNARVVWEFFVFSKPDGARDVDPSEALFDKLNVTWRHDFSGLKNTLVVGRQEITDLDPWLIFDGTPLDGSRTIFFDAVRNTLAIPDAQTTVDLIYIQQGGSENKHITPFGYERSRYFVENDEIGAILYVRNKSIERTQLDAAYIFRHTSPAAEGLGFRSNLNTLYASAQHAFDDHWIIRAAGAEQFGTRTAVRNGVEREDVDVWAHAFNARLTYKVRDAWDSDGYFGYEFLSGDDRNGNFNGFDPLWGRWPQFSEIVSSLYARETLPGYVTNLHRVYVGAITRPGPFELSANYHLLFAHHSVRQPGFTDNGHYRGQLVTATARWEVNRHIAMQLLGEAFIPGDVSDRSHRSTAYFARYEIVFKW